MDLDGMNVPRKRSGERRWSVPPSQPRLFLGLSGSAWLSPVASDLCSDDTLRSVNLVKGKVRYDQLKI